MTDVPAVQHILLRHRQQRPAIHLRPARNARPYGKPRSSLVRLIIRQKSAAQRSLHLADQDIPQLGQIIELEAAQITANRR